MVLEDIEIAAATRLKSLKDQTRQKLTLALANKKSLELKIDVKAPTIIIPVSCIEENSKILVVDLGTLVLKSSPKPRIKDSTIKDLDEDNFYDDFALQLTDITALITSNSEQWQKIDVEISLRFLYFFVSLSEFSIVGTTSKINAYSRTIFD